MLVLSNEDGGPHHVQGHRFKKASGFDIGYSSNIQVRLYNFLSFFIPMLSTKANTNICIYIFLCQRHSHMYVP